MIGGIKLGVGKRGKKANLRGKKSYKKKPGSLEIERKMPQSKS